jgi:hypothetical protein
LSGYHWELVFALVQAMSIFPMVAYLCCKSPASWGYLVYTGDIKTIWPLFGMSNQLLATCGLIVGTTMIIRMGKIRYAWVTSSSHHPRGQERPLAAGVSITAALSSLTLSGNFPRTDHLILKAKGLIVEMKSCSRKGIEG